jgi:signal transduction histidine kinase
MVERILAVSVEEGDVVRHNPTRVSLRELLQEVEGNCSAASKRVDFTLECDADIVVSADRFHLKNVLSTIVDNSIKYSDDEVAIRCRVSREGGWVTIAVADNGKGIASRHVEHIFDKFYRVPSGDRHDVRGYGLGLYYAHQVVERHGGVISASSSEGKGTTITIKLPHNGE